MPVDFFSASYIEKRSEPCPMTGCWLWTGQLQKNGYGVFRRFAKDKWHFAHRVSFEAFVCEIPSGLNVLHHCDNPACVNPLHLYAGTQKDNVRDMQVRGRSNYAHIKHEFCKRGHKLTQENRVKPRMNNCRICHNARQLERYHASV